MPSPIWAAPFLGEFGWLVSVWVPWLRGQAQKTDRQLSAYCQRGHEALFEDFANPVPVEVSDVLPTSSRDCHRAYRGSRQLDRLDYLRTIAVSAQSSALTPPDLGFVWTETGAPMAVDGVFRRYGEEVTGQRHVICVHARSVAQNDQRNWPLEKWDELLDHVGDDAVAVGSTDGALCPTGCIDMRGVPLSEVIAVLSLSRLVIGPSSGPLPLANLCETPVVWWSGATKDAERFRSAWNPFEVQNTQAAQSWDPSVDDVVRAVQEAL